MQALGWDQIDKRIMQRRHCIVHCRNDLFGFVRTGDRKDAGVSRADRILLDAVASRYDHTSVLGQRFADGIETFLFGAVEKTAGIHDNDIRTGVVWRKLIPFRPQTRDYALAIDKGLRASQRDNADLWWVLGPAGPFNSRSACAFG